MSSVERALLCFVMLAIFVAMLRILVCVVKRKQGDGIELLVPSVSKRFTKETSFAGRNAAAASGGDSATAKDGAADGYMPDCTSNGEDSRREPDSCIYRRSVTTRSVHTKLFSICFGVDPACTGATNKTRLPFHSTTDSEGHLLPAHGAGSVASIVRVPRMDSVDNIQSIVKHWLLCNDAVQEVRFVADEKKTASKLHTSLEITLDSMLASALFDLLDSDKSGTIAWKDLYQCCVDNDNTMKKVTVNACRRQEVRDALKADTRKQQFINMFVHNVDTADQSKAGVLDFLRDMLAGFQNKKRVRDKTGTTRNANHTTSQHAKCGWLCLGGDCQYLPLQHACWEDGKVFCPKCRGDNQGKAPEHVSRNERDWNEHDATYKSCTSYLTCPVKGCKGYATGTKPPFLKQFPSSEQLKQHAVEKHPANPEQISSCKDTKCKLQHLANHAKLHHPCTTVLPCNRGKCLKNCYIGIGSTHNGGAPKDADEMRYYCSVCLHHDGTFWTFNEMDTLRRHVSALHRCPGCLAMEKVLPQGMHLTCARPTKVEHVLNEAGSDGRYRFCRLMLSDGQEEVPLNLNLPATLIMNTQQNGVMRYSLCRLTRTHARTHSHTHTHTHTHTYAHNITTTTTTPRLLISSLYCAL